MKLVTLLLSFVTFFIYAQTDCKHGVSTDPESPKNVNSLPILANGNYNQQFINGFDWNQQPNIELTNMVFDGQQFYI